MGETVATNKKAFRDYHIEATWECGIELKGGEVKSIREREVNFKDSFARIEDGEVYLHNLHINPYSQAGYMNEEPDRIRKLLLHKKEINKIMGRVTQKNATLIPTKIYFNNRGFIKVELALATGKKLYDKRDAIKRKDIQRDLSRRLKRARR
jgi:SsrA-binding protein